MEGQSLSSRARATLRQGEQALPREQPFGGAGSSFSTPATPLNMAPDQNGGSGFMAGATSQITQQVAQRPWAALAVALAAGYAAGSLGGSSSSADTRSDPGRYFESSRDTSAWDRRHDTPPARGEYPGAISGASTYQASWSSGSSKHPQASQPGMFSQLASQFDDQISTVKDTLLSTLLDLMHDTIQQDAPALHQEIERLRRERGGQGATTWTGAAASSGSAQADRSKDPFRTEHEQEMY